MVRVTNFGGMLSHLLALALVLNVAALLPVECRRRRHSPAQPNDNNQPDQLKTTSRSHALDFNVLAIDFQQDNLKTDTLIKVINDTNGVNETTRSKLYNLISEQMHSAGSGWKRREIVYMDTIFTKRWVRELEGKMNVSYEGESKSDPAIHWEILYNGTTILVVRSASKYYYWTFAQSVVSFIILCMIVGGNLSILHRLKSCRRRRSNVNYFIVQLAIADLLVGIFSVTLDSVLRIQKAFRWNLFACRASKYIPALFIYSSTYLLVALSVDRWEAVVKPLAFTRNRSRGHHLVVASWLLAAISALPSLFLTIIKDIDGLPQCWIDLENYGWRIYMIYLTSLLLILPTLIIAICYIHIVYTIWSKGRLVAGDIKAAAAAGNHNNQKHHHKPRRQLSSSFYGTTTSPDSMNQELSTSMTRMNPNRASKTSQHLCFDARRVSWNNAGDQHEPTSGDRSLGASKVMLAHGDGQAPRSGELVGQKSDGRSGPELKSGADEIKAQDEQMPGKNHELNRGHTICSPTLNSVEWEQDNECHIQVASCDRAAVRGEDERYVEAAATRQRADAGVDLATTTVNLSDNGNASRATPVTTIEPAASQSIGQQHKSRLTSRMASRGLRMLPFVRSQSASSVGTSPSSSNSSSSSLALRSRSVGAAVATAADKRLPGGERPKEVGADGRDIAISDLGSLQVILRAGQVVVPSGSTCDRSLTVASDVGEVGAEAERRDAAAGRPGAQLAEADDVRGAMICERAQTNNAGNGHRDRNPLEGLSRSRESKTGASLAAPTGTTRRLSEDEPGKYCDSRRAGGEFCDGVDSTLKVHPTARRATGHFEGNNFDLRTDSRRPSSMEIIPIDLNSAAASAKGAGLWGVAAAALAAAKRGSRQKSPSLGETSGGHATIPPPFGGKRDKDFVAQQHGSGVIPKARIKTIKMTLVIVVAYILCWSPFLILNLCVVFGIVDNHTHFSHALLTLSQSLAHLNSAVNPIIFWLFSSKRGGGANQPANANKSGALQIKANRPAEAFRGRAPRVGTEPNGDARREQ